MADMTNTTPSQVPDTALYDLPEVQRIASLLAERDAAVADGQDIPTVMGAVARVSEAIEARLEAGAALDDALAAEVAERFSDMTAAEVARDVAAYREGTLQFHEGLTSGKMADEIKRALLEGLPAGDNAARIAVLKALIVLNHCAAAELVSTDSAERMDRVARIAAEVNDAYADAETDIDVAQRLYYDALDAEGIAAGVMMAAATAFENLRAAGEVAQASSLASGALDLVEQRTVAVAAWHIAIKQGAVPGISTETSASAVTAFVNAAAELRAVGCDLAAGKIDEAEAEGRVAVIGSLVEEVLVRALSLLYFAGILAGVTAGVMWLLGGGDIALLLGFAAGLTSAIVLDHATDVAAVDTVAALDSLARAAARLVRRAREALGSGWGWIREKLSAKVSERATATASVDA